MSAQANEPERQNLLNSIFIRCALIMGLTTVVVAGVLSVGASQLFDKMAVDDVNHQAERSMASGLEALAKPLRFKAMPKIEEAIENVMTGLGENGLSAIVLDAEGTPLSTRGDEGVDMEQVAALAEQARSTGQAQLAENGRLRAEPLLIGDAGEVLGVFAFSTSYEATRVMVWQNAQWIYMLAVSTFVIMMALTMWILHRSVGVPLRRLTAAVARIIDGDYDTESRMTNRRDEVGAIARSTVELLAVLREGRAAETARAEKQQQQMDVVEELGHALDGLADGVLHWRIESRFPEEYEALRSNFNRAVDHLRTVVVEVKNGAESILNSSDQIAAASDDLSRRTETQAATLEQSAAAMEEMLNAVKSAARNAGEANKTMVHTRQIAEKNGEVMKSAVTAMDEIEKSSDEISEITSVIDDIAFQTNLLALNAGVEAARAGESGKGFAVVASEVRGLAQRSAEAAQQIKDLILGSGEQVKHGVKLVEEAGLALEDVLVKVADVSKMVEQIAASAEDQAQGLNEINEGIANLDHVTQQNAAMVEQSTAAAQMLHQEADGLSKRVQSFATDKGHSAMSAGSHVDRAA